MRAEAVTPFQDLNPLHFRVRMVECTKVGAREVRTIADFEDEAAAEAFIQSKVAPGRNSGFNAGRHWGENTAGDQVCYWIETAQETASVQGTHAS
jgi:hypothetical protein